MFGKNDFDFFRLTFRWEICANNIRMKNAVSYMFVKEYISDNVINEVIFV